ncbi:MAG TPA: isochorismatase family protein [Oculatellaceae cyanobacterium]
MMQSELGKLELLTPQNSVLVLVDFQPSMFKGVASGDKARIKTAAVCAARAAKILDVPVVLSSIDPKLNGEFIKEITDLFPGVVVPAREVPSFDAFEDKKTWITFLQTGKHKVVLAGLWTSMCFAFTAVQAVRQGYEVYGLMDAAGDSTIEAHKYGIKRMMQVGVVPLTLEALVSEWMHDWNNPKAGELVKEVYSQFGGMIGWH